MKTRILSGVAATGLALFLAGCGGNNGGSATTSTGTTVSTTGDIAKVGNVSVSRADLISLLETQYGEQTLPYLIDTQLLFEQLKAKNIEVTDAEIEAELTRRKAQDSTLETTLKNANRAAFIRQQLKREIAVQKLLTQSVKAPTDAELKAFVAKYAADYDQPAKAKVGVLVTSTKARADIMDRALKAKTKTFDQLVAEQKKVNDPAAAQSTADTGEFQPIDFLPPAVKKQFETLPKGGTSTPQQFPGPGGSPIFVIFRKSDYQPVVKPDLTKDKAIYEADYKMAQVAQVEAKKNPQNPPFEQTLTQTKASLQQQLQQQAMMSGQMTPPPPVTLRDVLTTILGPARNNLLTELRTAGTVQISDPTYAKIGESYQPVPTPGAPSTGATGNETAPAMGNETAPAMSNETAPVANEAAPAATTAPAAP